MMIQRKTMTLKMKKMIKQKFRLKIKMPKL